SDLSRRFEVDRWPTDVVITPSGQKIASMVSPQDPQQYINTFTQIASRMLPPTPDTQTASLAPEQPYAPYSNTYSDRDPISGAPRPQTDPLQSSPYGSAANAAQAQYNSRYNGGNAVPAGPYSHNPPTSESAYQAAANNAYQASAAVNSA